MMLPATWKRAVLHSKAASVASVVVVCRGTWRKGAETATHEHWVTQSATDPLTCTDQGCTEKQKQSGNKVEDHPDERCVEVKQATKKKKKGRNKPALLEREGEEVEQGIR